MRRATASFTACFLGVTATWATACSSNSKDVTPNGPVFDAGGGVDVASDNPPDAHFTFDAPADHTLPGDARDAGGHDAHKDGDSTTSTTPDGTSDATSPDGSTATDAPSDGAGSADVVTTLDASVCASGTGTVAVVGGSSTVSFGAVSKNGAAFSLLGFGSATLAATPALIPFGSGFLTAFTTTNNGVVESTTYTPGATPAWSTAVAIPAVAGSDASATEIGAPSLASLAGDAELVYQGSNDKFYHGVESGGVWGPASDPVGGAGGSQDFGPSVPSAAAVGSTLYAAFDGGNQGLYVDSWTSGGGWAGAVGIGGAGTSGVPPTLIALTGGAYDLMLVFEVQTTNDLWSVVHTAGGTGAAAWSAPVQVDPTANTSTPASVAPLTGGGAVMVYLGTTDSLPYFSIYTPGAATPWTTPASVDPDSLPLASPPTVAPGVCNTDAIAALVAPAGIELVTLKAGVWAAPVLVSGTGSMTYAAVATQP